jgi:hypothetical protein
VEGIISQKRLFVDGMNEDSKICSSHIFLWLKTGWFLTIQGVNFVQLLSVFVRISQSFMNQAFGNRLRDNAMTDEEVRRIHQKIAEGGKIAVAEAIKRHRRLGESIAIWEDGKVVILEADQIPPMTRVQLIVE